MFETAFFCVSDSVQFDNRGVLLRRRNECDDYAQYSFLYKMSHPMKNICKGIFGHICTHHGSSHASVVNIDQCITYPKLICLINHCV